MENCHCCPHTKKSNNVSDLRPISLLPLPGKILEIFIHNKFTDYLEFFQILFNCQFGFRPTLSTTVAIFTFTNDIGINLNNNRLTLTTFINFRKAFDTLDHTLLINTFTNSNEPQYS